MIQKFFDIYVNLGFMCIRHRLTMHSRKGGCFSEYVG